MKVAIYARVRIATIAPDRPAIYGQGIRTCPRGRYPESHVGLVLDEAPIVTMRLSSVKGRKVESLLADRTSPIPHWALRREFRSTYRDKPAASETIVAGKWFSDSSLKAVYDTGEVSLEDGIAKELLVKLGDIITWNVQGVDIPTRITSLRKVTWTRFEPNFFAVFAPPVLRGAPNQYVLLAQVKDPTAVALLQRCARLPPLVHTTASCRC